MEVYQAANTHEIRFNNNATGDIGTGVYGNDNEWHNFIFNYNKDASVLDLLIDGSVFHRDVSTDFQFQMDITVNRNPRFGTKTTRGWLIPPYSAYGYTFGEYPWSGKIFSFRVWDRSLESTEINMIQECKL